jgi:DNA-binding CsgD family transcriptional regulator
MANQQTLLIWSPAYSDNCDAQKLFPQIHRANWNTKTSRTGDGEEFDLLNQILDDRTAHNPEQQLLRREFSARILRALERLTPRERMVVDLKHFQGMKLRAVGDILNTSASSVKTSLMRATQKLRFQLAGYTKLQKSSMRRRCDQPDVSKTANPAEERGFMATATSL